MSSTYKVSVNTIFDFEFTEEDISKIDMVSNSKSTHHILQNNKSFHTEIVQSDFDTKKYTVKVNNNSYQVNITNELDTRIAAMGFSIGSSKQVNAIKAPMPGLLLDVQVEIGQEVKEDDPLLILEAMKMENIILSPRDGVIKSISATTGDAVDKGQLLIEFA
ncbi:biotin carboxyl carrier protein [Aquimarina sp. EL_43]|uniref:acetyl-CoA carboxylase biotin carboxyl carrier protein subunit n=1 Tax=unclassified Aquimarina TaxID=2627091 RepID=UPI0018C961D7|nr:MULTISPECIES: acetyl-CoA carboxylase biotin carboxyl carrier protein subunit [unclassified Aquimarina]MBG6132263.1 biotin carboxyl carrier protein [Aquimarina sp. EL_35]MBG6153747.1 biotin carboxyl carrier protein [Aquimarina sp. EL_32]MBG6171903.1 biotin carboxyl carrier protein [Aquimarina sp. EL_43]